MSDNIFVKKKTFTSLEEFAKFVFDLLKFGGIEEHHSANYWGEQYFLAYAGDASLTIAAADDTGFAEYDYWISVKVPSEGGGSPEESVLGEELARTLASMNLRYRDRIPKRTGSIANPLSNELSIVRGS